MEELRVIKETKELEGTCYFELLPGKYMGKCWNSNSVYLSEETFGFLEKVIQSVVAEYDHYSFVAIKKGDWAEIVREFSVLISRLQSAKELADVEQSFYCMYSSTKTEFEASFSENKILLIGLLEELSAWLNKQLENEEFISVLGI